MGNWLAVPRVRWPVSDLGNRPDEPPISPATLGRQRAPLGLGQMVGSSDLSLGPILTHPPRHLDNKNFLEDLTRACGDLRASAASMNYVISLPLTFVLFGELGEAGHPM